MREFSTKLLAGALAAFSGLVFEALFINLKNIAEKIIFFPILKINFKF